ncbi:sel1 repeat family protein [Cellulomonas algicola]|uniref:sel1 repeat family protein n=1 Tax=Cellulomonas algicola TaxID=2071633 RepID=UPI000F561187|nr:sel1 repeat family protein [Cellulomonas algicola]
MLTRGDVPVLYLVLVVSAVVTLWRWAAPLLLVLSAVLSVLAFVGDRSGPGPLVWWLWGLGLVGLGLRALHRAGQYRSLDDLVAASDAGVPRAMRVRGLMLKIEGDLDGAEGLIRAAAEKGDREAMWELGRLVEDRDGLAASEPWFRMAAEHGHLAARQFFRRGHALNLDGSNPL